MEYMVKFNLQKHLEQFHTVEERNTNAEEIIKVRYGAAGDLPFG
jgi:hypothetical protein